jgi:hypothetical protein
VPVCHPERSAAERRIWAAKERNLLCGGQILRLCLRMTKSVPPTNFSESVLRAQYKPRASQASQPSFRHARLRRVGCEKTGGQRKEDSSSAFIALWVPTERGKRPGPAPGPLHCIPPAAALGSLASVALSSEPALTVYRVQPRSTTSPLVPEMRLTQSPIWQDAYR